MEPFDHLNQHAHHVVALFGDPIGAEKAVHELGVDGSDRSISILIAEGEELPPSDASGERRRDVLAGGALGGMIGLVAGALAFGVPGVGTVVGAGIWSATGVGAALGASVGLEVTDYHRAWEGQYQTAVADGNVLVALSTDDPLLAVETQHTFVSLGAQQIDHFDRHGKAIVAPTQ